ncbi:hypothetical protein PMKS-002011 [Pichia membranifaciens]|uniref:Uncharacterized protein n=1 Tax=Pichia membranifaciens TaxID=4926 RepID=A0A1Q2YG48_9ASCO|nr:hypothetical protein PMKS-002011 [Pichia membranifaciens]
MQFSRVFFTLAAVSAVQAASNTTTESTSVSTAGANGNAYGSAALGAVAAAAAWVRDQVREEMRAKMEKRTAIDAAAESNTSTIDPLREVPEEQEDEEQWPELFGGETVEYSPGQNGRSSYRKPDDDTDATISQIKQTPMFSTFLRTSSQPIPSEEEEEDDDGELAMLEAAARDGKAGMTAGEMDAFDALTAAETGLEGLLSDDDNDNDESHTDSAPAAGQFSQYLARHESSQPQQSQTQTQASNTSVFSDDDFSDNDDDAALLL